MAATISFDVSASGIPPGALRVVSFEGEEGLSRPYRFEIEAVSDDPNLALETLPGKPATLTMRRETDERQIHGVLAEIGEGGVAAGGFYAYRLVLVPRLWLLTLSRHNRTLGTVTPMTVVEVVSAVLSERDGLQLGGEDFSFRLSNPGAYPARPFWAQYNESDFDFISRLLEHWGIGYYFEQGADEERLVFVDSNIMLPRQQVDGDLPYDSRAGAPLGGRGIAHSLRRQLRPVPKQARLKDYNYELPQLALEASQPVADGTFGEYVEYAAHFRDTAEGNVLAQARAEELGSRRDTFELETDSLFVSAGQLFSLHDHFRSALNQDYLPTAVRHFGEQPLAGAYAEAGGVRPGYHNEVTAIPAETAYRPERRTPQAKVPQLMPAVVDAEEAMSERAMLDAQGRYKVAIDFDMTQSPVYKRSAYLRMAQPYGGPEAGFHFPLRKGTEVLLGWRDGDPDRPMILSAVPNPLSSSPVTQLNHTQNKIQTPSGIMLVMDDGPGNAANGGGAPAAPANPSSGQTARAPAAGANGGQHGTDKRVSIYMAYTVPAADTSELPHYWRVGAVAPDSPSPEQAILKNKVFGADKKADRSTELTDANYAGFFSYTPDNLTVTIAGEATTVIGGDRRTDIGENDFITVEGSRHLLVEGEVNETTHIPAGVVLNYSGTFAAGAWAKGFTLERTLGVHISYGALVSYDASANYTFQSGLEVNCELAPSFTYSMFPSYTVWPASSWLTNMDMDGDGYMTYPGPSGFVDTSEIYATDKIVLGARGISGTPLAATNRIFSRMAHGAAAIGTLGLGFDTELIVESAIKMQDPTYNPNAAWTDTMSEIMASTVVPTTVGIIDAIVAVRMFLYNNVEKKALAAASNLEPTITIDNTGITLRYFTNYIRIAKTGIIISGDRLSINSDSTARISADAAMTITSGPLSVTADTTRIASDTIRLVGETNVVGNLGVTGDADVLGELAAAAVLAGA